MLLEGDLGWILTFSASSAEPPDDPPQRLQEHFWIFALCSSFEVPVDVWSFLIVFPILRLVPVQFEALDIGDVDHVAEFSERVSSSVRVINDIVRVASLRVYESPDEFEPFAFAHASILSVLHESRSGCGRVDSLVMRMSLVSVDDFPTCDWTSGGPGGFLTLQESVFPAMRKASMDSVLTPTQPVSSPGHRRVCVMHLPSASLELAEHEPFIPQDSMDF